MTSVEQPFFGAKQDPKILGGMVRENGMVLDSDMAHCHHSSSASSSSSPSASSCFLVNISKTRE